MSIYGAPTEQKPLYKTHKVPKVAKMNDRLFSQFIFEVSPVRDF